jgi:flagellar biosynthetic protein FliR
VNSLAPLLPHSMAVFVLMLVRVGTMLMLMPGFSGRNIPTPIKAGFAIVLTLVLVPVSPTSDQAINDTGRFVVGVGQEFLVGLLMGFAVALVFGAVEIAAGLISLQMGLSLGQTFNPAFGSVGTALDTFYLVVATLIFFSLNAHHLLIVALARSFEVIPVGTAALSGSLQQSVISLSSAMFINALRIGLPIAGTLLIADAALGILSRMVPQMNVFFVGLPAKIFAGFALLLLTLPFLINVLATMMTSGIGDAVTRAVAVPR